MAFHSFERLEVWQRARRLAVDTYRTLRSCPDRALKEQMTRAAVSVASNIAEGAERTGDRDFIRFLSIAKGSAVELRTQLYIASEIGAVNREESQKLIQELRELSAMLQGLAKRRSVQRPVAITPKPTRPV